MIPAAALLLAIVVFLHFLPRLTRPGLFFGVTVDPAFPFSPAAARITRSFRITLWSLALFALALFWVLRRPEIVFLFVAAYYLAMGVAHRRSLPYAVQVESAVEVDLCAPPESLPGGPALFLLPVASLVLLALWIWLHWDRIPAQFPTHWGVNGPDRWASRTPAAISNLLVQDALFSLMFVLMAAGVLHLSRRTPARSSVGAEERRFRRISSLILLLLACVPAAQAWVVVLQPAPRSAWLFAAPLAAFAAYLAVMIRNRPRLSSRSGDLTPNDCWKLGIFYFNPSDPALFVLQRFGIGYTFNFGNRWSWAAFATVLLAVSVRAVLR